MSKRTIRILDTSIQAGRLNKLIGTVTKELAGYLERDEIKMVQQCESEIHRYTTHVMRKRHALQRAVDALTDEELSLIRRRYQPFRLRKALLSLGVSVRW
jgi:hypothetical protein